MKMLKLEELKEIRAAYQAAVVERLGPKAEDMAMSAECMHDLLGRIMRRRAGMMTTDVYRAPTVIELGSGFSTLALLELDLRTSAGLHIISVDHARPWQAFIRGLVEKRTASLRSQEDIEAGVFWEVRGDYWDAPLHGDYGTLAARIPGRFDVLSMDAFRAATDSFPAADFMIVDHGPDLPTRAANTGSWLPGKLARHGTFVFDDWRPKHEGRIRRALAAHPDDWIIESGGDHLKRFPRDKTIGYARRR